MAKQRNKSSQPSSISEDGHFVHGATLAHRDNSAGKTNVMSASYSGPLPPPALLNEYESIVPGMASGLMKNFESEQKHRRDWENRLIEIRADDMAKEHIKTRSGQLCALVLGLTMVVACAVITVFGIVYDSKTGIGVGATLGGLMLLGTISSFLSPKPKQVLPSKGVK
jgi:uncharacterized membrane protein